MKNRFVMPLLFYLVCLPMIARQSAAPAEEEKREQWQKVPEIFQLLGVKPGSWVADIGAGSGFFTVRLGSAVGPNGRVFAVDIDAEAITKLRERIEEEALNQVEVIHGASNDPKLAPASLDGVLIVDTYHEMKEHEAMLRHIREALKTDGRLVVLDYKSDKLSHKSRDEQTREHVLTSEITEAELLEAGFEIIEKRDPFATRDDREKRSTLWLIAARKNDTKVAKIHQLMTADHMQGQFSGSIAPGVIKDMQ